MSRRELVLHIGAHKTGTTAIQVFLRRHRAALKARGFEVLLPPTPGGRPANWNFMFRIDEGPLFRLKPVELQKMQAGIERSDDNIILSSEEFFFLRPPQVKRFAAAIAGKFESLHLVVYLRRQDRMAISHWQQGARTRQSAVLFGSSEGPLKNLSDAAFQYLDYTARLRAWISALSPSKVSVRVYDRTRLAEGDAVTDFLQVVGLETLSTAAPSATMNDALGTETVFLLYELRDRGVSQADIAKILRSGILPQGTPGGLPARMDARTFMERFAETNRHLSEVAGQPVAFSDDFSDYPEMAELPRFPEAMRAKILKRIDTLLLQP